jgi:hypothetical protein
VNLTPARLAAIKAETATPAMATPDENEDGDDFPAVQCGQGSPGHNPDGSFATPKPVVVSEESP